MEKSDGEDGEDEEVREGEGGRGKEAEGGRGRGRVRGARRMGEALCAVSCRFLWLHACVMGGGCGSSVTWHARPLRVVLGWGRVGKHAVVSSQ